MNVDKKRHWKGNSYKTKLLNNSEISFFLSLSIKFQWIDLIWLSLCAWERCVANEPFSLQTLFHSDLLSGSENARKCKSFSCKILFATNKSMLNCKHIFLTTITGYFRQWMITHRAKIHSAHFVFESKEFCVHSMMFFCQLIFNSQISTPPSTSGHSEVCFRFVQVSLVICDI